MTAMSPAARKAFGSRLRERRTREGLSLRALGEAAAVHFTWISHLEAGRREPSLGTVYQLANALRVDAGWLAFGGDVANLRWVLSRPKQKAVSP